MWVDVCRRGFNPSSFPPLDLVMRTHALNPPSLPPSLLGADPFVKDREGKSPLDLVMMGRHALSPPSLPPSFPPSLPPRC